MAPATSKDLEIKITAMMRMGAEVLKELKKDQKQPTKSQDRSLQMAADLKMYMKTRKRKVKIPTK